jgi:alpha-tubulin suppressor-like RCC1 family protein
MNTSTMFKLYIFFTLLFFVSSNPQALLGWGENLNGKLVAATSASGGAGSYVTTPTLIDDEDIYDQNNIIAIANGQYHMLVLLNDGSIYGRGVNSDGQLGNGGVLATGQQSAYNVLVDTTAFTNAGATITAIAAGLGQSFALASGESKVFGWGYFFNAGQQFTPVLFSSSDLVGKTLTKLFAGYANSFVIDSDGKVYGWGYNDDATNLLYPTVGPSDDFVAVQAALPSIQQISIGGYHVLALGDDGKVYAWGNNDYGQLGVSLHF